MKSIKYGVLRMLTIRIFCQLSIGIIEELLETNFDNKENKLQSILSYSTRHCSTTSIDIRHNVFKKTRWVEIQNSCREYIDE